MNTIGNLGGAAGGWATSAVLKLARESYIEAHNLSATALSEADKLAAAHTGYQINFVIYAAIYLVAVLMWLRVDATKPIVPESAGGTP